MARPGIDRILGVDFGTTTVLAGVSDSAGPQFVVDRGEPAIAAAVHFPRRGEPILGADALRMLAVEPANTVRSVKRLLGRRVDDPEVVALARRLHYPLKDGGAGQLILGLGTGDVACEQLVAHILRTLRDMAEKRFACQVRRIVATVPATAGSAYTSALGRAAAIASLEVVETLPEPVAGALPMGLHLEQADRLVLVCDFGGGTFDASLISAGYRRLDVIATAGDDALGGDDFDERLLEVVGGALFSQTSVDTLRDAVLRHRLLLWCEQAKRALSRRQEVRLRLDDAFRQGGRFRSLDLLLTRDMAEPSWVELVERALATVRRLLKAGACDPAEIEQVALIGGTSLVPLFRRRLAAMFRPGVVRENVAADTAVAHGAILRCAAFEAQAAAAQHPPLASAAAK